MTRKYSLVIEGDGAGYSGYVPGLPTILVTGNSIDDLTARAKEAVRLYWETLHTDRSTASTVREIARREPAVARVALALRARQAGFRKSASTRTESAAASWPAS